MTPRRKGSNTAAASANTLKATGNHVFAWSLWNSEGPRLASEGVRPAVAKVARLMTLSAEARILSINPRWSSLNSNHLKMMKDLIPRTVVVGNAWKHFLRQESHVCAKCRKKSEKQDCQLKVAKYVLAKGAIPAIIHTLGLRGLWVSMAVARAGRSK